MQTEKRPSANLELVFRILVSVMCTLLFAVGLLFIAFAAKIYFTGGDAPFTRESIGDALRVIFPVSLVFVLLAIETAVLSRFVPQKKEKGVPVKPATRFKLATSRMGASGHSEEYTVGLALEEKKRGLARLVFSVPSAIIALTTLVLISIPARYSGETVNEDVAMSSVIVFSAFLVIASGAVVLTSFIDRSYFRSLEIIKKEREKYGTGEGISDSEIRTAGHSVMIVRFALILLSVTFIIVGILGGDTEDVLGKAIRICTECIGLG